MARKSPVHYIAPSAISIVPNCNGSANDLAVYLVRGAKIRVYSKGTVEMGDDASYQEWTLTGRNRRLNDSNSKYTIYARLSKEDRSDGYLIFAPQRDVDGTLTDKYPAVGLDNAYYGQPDEKYWYVRMGEVTLPDNGLRTVDLDTGILGTDQYNSQWALDPDDLPLRVELSGTIDDEDAGPTPYVYWNKVLTLTASLMEGWTSKDVDRFDHWEITRNTGDENADNAWNHPDGAGSYRTLTDGAITLNHSQTDGDDYNGALATIFTVTAKGTPEPSEAEGLVVLASASITVFAESAEKYDMVLSSNVISYDQDAQKFIPESGITVRVRTTDQRGATYDLTYGQFENLGFAIDYKNAGDNGWTPLPIGGATDDIVAATIPASAFSNKDINVRLVRIIKSDAGAIVVELVFATVSYIGDTADSREREWIFLRSRTSLFFGDANSEYPEPALISWGEKNPTGAAGRVTDNKDQPGWVPEEWWDKEQGVDDTYYYEYASHRDYIQEDGGGHWGDFSEPCIWHQYKETAITYDLVPNVSVIHADADGTVNTDGIIVKAYRTVGDKKSDNILPEYQPPQGEEHYYAQYRIDNDGQWQDCGGFIYVNGNQVYGISPIAVRTATKNITLRLLHSSNSNVVLKEIAPIDVVKVISEQEVIDVVDGGYITKDFFNTLFEAIDSNGQPITPNGRNNDGTQKIPAEIHAKVGLWSSGFISALGKNSSGSGGGGAVTLTDLTDVNPNMVLSDGQVLKYDETLGLWTAADDAGVDPQIYATKAWVQEQNYLTSAALNGYATESYVLNNYQPKGSYLTGITKQMVTDALGYTPPETDTWRGITNSYNPREASSEISLSQAGAKLMYNELLNGYATNAGNADTLDGQHGSYYAAASALDNYLPLTAGITKPLTDDLYINGNINAVNSGTKELRGFRDIELFGAASSQHGGYIDFHYESKKNAGNDVDYTSRIIEDADGRLNINETLYVNNSGNVDVGAYLPNYVTLDVNGYTKTVRLYLSANVYLEYDGNGGVHLVGAGFYADSYVSALGKNDASGSGGLDIEAMWSELMNIDNTKVIDISHIPTIPTSKINNLIGYVTDCLTDYASIAGNTIYIGEDSLNLNNYLPLIGGGMDGNIYWQYSGRRTTRLEIGQHTLSTTADYDYYLSAMAGGGLSPLFGVRTDGTVEAVRYIIGSDLTIDNEYIAYHYENAAGTIEKDANISLEYGFHYESKNGATTKYTNIIDDHITLSSGSHAVNIISTGMTIDGNAVRHAGDTYYSGGSLVVGGVTVPLSSGDYLLKSGDTMTGNLTIDGEASYEHYLMVKNRRKSASGGGWAVDALHMTGNDNAAYFTIGAYGANDTLNYVYLGSNAYDSVDNLRIYPNGDVGVGDNAVIFSYANSQTWNIEGVNSGIRILNAAGTNVLTRPAGAPGDYHTALSVCGYYGFQIAAYGGTQGGLMYRKIGSGDVYSDSDYDTSWHELANTDDLAGYATTSALNDYLNKSVGGYISGDITLGGSKLTQTYNGGSEEDPESCALVIEDGVIILDTNGKIQTSDGSYFFGDGGYAAFYSLNVGDNLISHTSDYLELGSVGNEILIDGSGATTMYINYRSSANNMATPTTFVWNAGSSSSYADHQMGGVIASGFAKRGGTSTQFLKADGSVDSNTYATTSALNGYLPLTAGSTAPLTGDLYMGTNKLDMMTVGNVGTILNHEKLEIKAIGAYGEQQPNTTVTAGSITINGNAVWHAGNDGAGSGLDADLLDGQHGSYYATASDLSNYLNKNNGGTIYGDIALSGVKLTQSYAFGDSSDPEYGTLSIEDGIITLDNGGKIQSTDESYYFDAAGNAELYSLTINGETAATQNWVTGQGYITGYGSGTGITIASGYVSISDAYLTKINNAENDRHTHSNKSVLDGITPQHIDNWDSAFDDSHTHDNMSALNAITDNFLSFTAKAGGSYTGWRRIMKWDLNNSNYWDSASFTLFITRNYYSPAPESYLVSVVWSWNERCSIKVLNCETLTQIVKKLRIGVDGTNHRLYLEMYVDTAYSTYQNDVYVRAFGNILSATSVEEGASGSETTYAETELKDSYVAASVLGNYATTSELSGYLPLSGGGVITSGDYSLGVSEKRLEFKYNNTVYGSISLDYGIDGAEFDISSNATLGGETIATQAWVGQQGYVGSSALNSYLPKSAGSGNALTGDLYMGGNSLYMSLVGGEEITLNNKKLELTGVAGGYGQTRPKTTVTAGSITINGNTVATTNQIYDATKSRTANTVLAAPNGSNGVATFRSLVTADISNLSGYISDQLTDYASIAGSTIYIGEDSISLGNYLLLTGGTLTGNLTIDGEASHEHCLKVKNQRNSSSGGGWAVSALEMIDNGNTSYFAIGAYGSNSTLGYTYLGSNAYNSDNNLRIYQGGGIRVSGRCFNDGNSYDDEGIIVAPANNGYAGLCLGNPVSNGRRSVFYLNSSKAFWRYNSNGSNSYDIEHPNKSGTIALTSDIPTTGTGLSIESGHIGINSTYQSYISHGESAYNSLSSYLLKSGDSMTGDLTMGANSVVFNSSTSSTWNVGNNSGLKILNTVGASSIGAPGDYHVGLSICGYYGFQLSTFGGTTGGLMYRKIGAGYSYSDSDYDTSWHNLAISESGYADPYGNTDRPWHLVAEFSQSNASQQINTGITLMFSEFYSGTSAGIMKIRCRYNSDTATPDFLYAQWLVNNGIPVNDVVVTHSKVGKIVYLRLYVKRSDAWGTYNIYRIEESGWSGQDDAWVLHEASRESSAKAVYTFASIPSSETKVASTFLNTDCGVLHVNGAGTALAVDNNAEIDGTLFVDGATTINNILNVDDDITITSLEKGIVFYSGNYIKTNTSNWLVVNGGDDIHFNIGGETMMYVDDTGTYADNYQTISDIRKKDVIRYDALPDFDDVWRAPAISFRWKEKMDGGVHLGSVAQYWETILPETVHEDRNGYLSMQYDVIALLAAISTARKVQNHEEEIAALKHRIGELENEVEQLKAA